MRLAFLLLTACAASYSQVSARVALSNGIQLTITTRSDNGAPKLKISLEPASGDSFYRIFRDDNDLAVFAYELQVARTADGENFRVTAKPATQAFAARFANADGGKPTPTLPAPLESPLLSSGQAFDIPIPTAPELAQTLTDTVQILMAERGLVNQSASGSARIQFLGLKVSIHGQPVTPSGAGADVAGRYTMFFLPGHGGYFFSTESVAQPPVPRRWRGGWRPSYIYHRQRNVRLHRARPDSGSFHSRAVMGVSRFELPAGRQLDQGRSHHPAPAVLHRCIRFAALVGAVTTQKPRGSVRGKSPESRPPA